MSENKFNKYVLITAARNEEKYIEKTIQSVINQSILPQEWIIVSDGSTDNTDKIVLKYKNKYDFIELVQTSGDQTRNFGSKAKAVNFGSKLLTTHDYFFIGNLDADVSFDSTYYENILMKFNQNKNLGIAGGTRYDLVNGKFHKVNCAKNSVGGPFQFFRRECFEKIGGYTASRFGGVDAIAEVQTRMNGWEVESFAEFAIYHYRATGTAISNSLAARYRIGVLDYVLGYHPVFEIVRIAGRLLERPVIFGSLVILSGFIFAAIKRYKRPVNENFISYLRKEQIQRLKDRFTFTKHQ
ncbi:glycosyltransferase family 2 protein [candidate division KSB1 bacterium]|nr:glycosyltransferase family 2 protein [candidate division KSB1 bacterium]MBL7093226.1 glycosyltransferase family 2 protein [candidate division KSB1 bacterium]